jgi:hypothetical protein
MISIIFMSEGLTADFKRLILWLLERQPAPLSLFRNTDPGWWTELRRHRLSPLLYARLLSAGLVEGVPKAVTQLLRHDYLGALQLFLGQERESRQLLTKLGDAGIEAILLKGADLRLRLYEDPATRPMTDLDLLVSPASLGAVRGFLGNLGYTLSRDSVNPRPGFRERYRVGLHFRSPPPASLMVDLHWGLEAVAGYYRLPYARLAPQAQTLDWEAIPLRVLSPEHTLLHLCLHFYDEGDIALQLLDLALALKRLPINWPGLLTEAARCRCQAPLCIVLRGLEELLPGSVPPQVLGELGTYVPWGPERLVLRHSHHPVARLLGPLHHQRRPSAWAYYLGAILWPDPAYLTAVSGSPSRLAYLSSSLPHLVSRRDSP